MRKVTNREKILTEGLRLVHERGFANASVRDIVAAAGVPQGSFTNHFASKEAFALEIIDLYYARHRETIAATLRNDTLSPLRRLGAYIDASKARFDHTGQRCGCLFGNFTAEASEESEGIRKRLVGIFAETQQSVLYCLRAAVNAKEISPQTDCNEVAGFIVTSLQGANLMAKAQRSTVPFDRFKHILFTRILA